MNCYKAGNILLNLAIVGQHLRVTVHDYPPPPDVIDFAILPSQRFLGKQFHCKMSRDLEVTNESPHRWQRIPAV